MIDFIREWGTELSIIIRICGIITVVLFFLPLQIKEAAVKNGLRLLRYELLAGGVLFMLINFPSLYFLFQLMNKSGRQPFTNSSLQLLNAVGYFAIALLLAIIYRQQFTDEAKRYHDKVSKLEQKDKKK